MERCDLLLLALVNGPLTRVELFRRLGERLGPAMMYTSTEARYPFVRDVEQLVHEGYIADRAGDKLELTDSGKGHLANDPLCIFVVVNMAALLQQQATGRTA